MMSIQGAPVELTNKGIHRISLYRVPSALMTQRTDLRAHHRAVKKETSFSSSLQWGRWRLLGSSPRSPPALLLAHKVTPDLVSSLMGTATIRSLTSLSYCCCKTPVCRVGHSNEGEDLKAAGPPAKMQGLQR